MDANNTLQQSPLAALKELEKQQRELSERIKKFQRKIEEENDDVKKSEIEVENMLRGIAMEMNTRMLRDGYVLCPNCGKNVRHKNVHKNGERVIKQMDLDDEIDIIWGCPDVSRTSLSDLIGKYRLMEK